MSTTTICNKCLKDNPEHQIECHTAALVDSKDRSHILTKLDLCDPCRQELKEVLFKWLNDKNMEEQLVITYESENITLNKGEEHIVLDKTEQAFLLRSLLNNLKVEYVKIS